MTARFTVTYRLFAADRAEALARAEGIALEQTVEIPRDVVPPGFIEDEILGRVQEIGTEAEGQWRATVSYSPQSCGAELPQLLNVVFGNSSIQRGIKVIGLDLGPLTKAFPGARFGVGGLRRLADLERGPFIAPVLKPQGSSAAQLAETAYLCAMGGAHIVKEDHGLTNQPCAPFRDRVEAIAEALARARARTGRPCLYFAGLAGHSEELDDMAAFAVRAGVDGLLLMPGLFGFDTVHRLARNDRINLPIMTHPSFLGPYVLSSDTGFSHAMMFGTLQRLAGADISVFPNVGGRFGFTAQDCAAIAAACGDPAGIGRAILPSPGGGMSPERGAGMLAMYGEDAVFLLGGSLLRHGARIGEAIADLRNGLAG
ncbi:RuBisCO large subunit C-terminal-like domain-containing protein [Sedimentitalea nanhaiensis]|uniref:Ribulose 1,5-bisphosphate carboxylase large subunit n=1 Tax=Sedimentitalea nanhaiensis TaxID=999627 RepID=A0A1I7BGS4_9RHOB|nr:RuBisCO large subunit C-terminal-like domain-containing protein [Sedimentitalea nanhaiensis]SFT86389.1 ribulose-1,5-bisphosphate carboxylase/oxygenase large subunit [Sedimentitalea nanhaiensis]